ncbi:hypothetical protein [Bradyrhizobium sp. JYMT SZCCT0428]|uniref:hypothetical protein n=1 Tax=Bradyrhizobium sp. JYMT SZCCT0428 TaxID=2807673 RepID=UPI001BA5F61D|nr:hypothetical protein [Bradyrhizobium sp. JYMT SZCCT0428]MBR1149705.1 hypothetical protein [Bradyrhizobium sp. JYMT SZCCT0428]
MHKIGDSSFDVALGTAALAGQHDGAQSFVLLEARAGFGNRIEYVSIKRIHLSARFSLTSATLFSMVTSTRSSMALLLAATQNMGISVSTAAQEGA